ncbi:transcriptional regulator [Tamaricihabitans halophyticus]|uniref:Transcriptional regulator n=1 Tax=Tamaricihabitans halophyticus TaxID=1262583 RepID=A0A4R2QUX1_9PSEU|nr:WYL domain-containing protein [Tamaricihabitans halophyticus]TCP50895.1 transcriptional regulator [Tamaricihabitans halophyticus]
MSTARAERLVNLVLCLLSTRQYLTAERIRGIVPGYADAASDEAFFRMFERDKTELRELGIPLETGKNSTFDAIDGYRIARRDYELGEVDLEPDETAAVALAVRLWDSPEFTGQARGALLKLRAAGVEVDQSAPAASVQPRVRVEPAFAPLLAAAQNGMSVRFDYRKPNSSAAQGQTARNVEPWGVVSWRGRWYVVGYDRDRTAPRCFRLSRIVGQVSTDTAARTNRPDGVNLLEMVAGTGDTEPTPSSTATVWVADGRAAGVRRSGQVVERREVAGTPGDIVHLEFRHVERLAGWLTGFGPDVLVLDPDVLAKTVHERLLVAAGLGDQR